MKNKDLKDVTLELSKDGKIIVLVYILGCVAGVTGFLYAVFVFAKYHNLIIEGMGTPFPNLPIWIIYALLALMGFCAIWLASALFIWGYTAYNHWPSMRWWPNREVKI